MRQKAGAGNNTDSSVDFVCRSCMIVTVMEGTREASCLRNKFTIATKEIRQVLMWAFHIHSAEPLLNYHLDHKNTHGNTDNLSESVVICGCVSSERFENTGPAKGGRGSGHKGCKRSKNFGLEKIKRVGSKGSLRTLCILVCLRVKGTPRKEKLGMKESIAPGSEGFKEGPRLRE